VINMINMIFRIGKLAASEMMSVLVYEARNCETHAAAGIEAAPRSRVGMCDGTRSIAYSPRAAQIYLANNQQLSTIYYQLKKEQPLKHHSHV